LEITSPAAFCLSAATAGLLRDPAWRAFSAASARRLNLDGDGQADLRGHGDAQRAVMVYQLE